MPNDAPTQLVNQFYTAFQQKDYATMNACYHPQAEFSDPVFVGLKGKEVCAMWHMLCERGTDLKVTFNNVHAHGEVVHAHWEATYTFSSSKRPVHNIIDATIALKDGKIVQHNDYFNLWRWTRMALGPTGLLLGWSSIVQNKVRATARQGLRVFIEKHPEYQS